MRQLILHIGTEKTGTTSLQNDLYRNRAYLAANGVGLLSGADLPNNRRIASYARLRPAHEAYDLQLVSSGPDWRERLRNAVRSEIEAMPASIHTVLVTSEHLHSRLVDVKEVQRVADIFTGLFGSTRVVVYLRRQDKLATSLYSTALRAGWTHTSPFKDGAAAAQGHYYDYGGLLSRWGQVFGRDSITARIFEPRQFEGGSLHSDFLHACGLPGLAAGWQVGQQQNEALPAPVASTVLAFNQALASLGAGRESEPANALRWQLIHSLSSMFSGPSLVPQRQQAQEFMSHFRASNDAVARAWFGRDTLFDDDLGSYPEQAQEAQIPLSAFTVMQPLLLQAAAAYAAPSSGKPQAEQLHKLMTALREIPPGAPSPAVVRRVGQALHDAVPTLAQRLLDIGHQLRAAAGQVAHKPATAPATQAAAPGDAPEAQPAAPRSSAT